MAQENNRYSDGSGKDRLLVYSMELASQKEFLKDDKNFKKKVLDELPDKVDLKIATRVYIESMSRVHCAARKLVENTLKESRSIIECAWENTKKYILKNL